MELNTEGMNRNESVLLAVRLDPGGLRLRIDRNSLAQKDFHEPPVLELSLVDCSVSEESLKRLLEGVDKPFYYEYYRQDDSITTLVTIDYNFDDVELTCKDLREESGGYTQGDLTQKCTRLANLYSMRGHKLELLEDHYYRVGESLRKAFLKEIDISERKAAFFAQSRPERAAESAGYVRAYQEAFSLLDSEMVPLNDLLRP